MRTFLLIMISAFIAGCASKDDGEPVGTNAQAIETCGTTGDQDGDLVPDLLDTSQTDSCLSDPYGFGLNDCSTGAGDGIPDCE